MIKEQYSEETYRDILNTLLERGYVTSRFDQPRTADLTLYLRHDIDLSVEKALRIAHIEHSHGVNSNFFCQFDSEVYNLWTEKNRQALVEIAEMGHLVGLHINEDLIGIDEKSISRTIDWFSSTIFPVSKVFSFHRPTKAAINARYVKLTSCYDAEFFKPQQYCSDAARNLDFFSKLDHLSLNASNIIQWLTHPGWWADKSDQKLFQEIMKKRQKDVAAYLSYNFRKVFSEFVN